MQAEALRGAALSLVLMGLGCARQPVPLASPTVPAEMDELKVQLAARDRRVDQLEGRLAMLEASQRELREALRDRAPSGVRETVRIGEHQPASARPPTKHEEALASGRERAEARPLLRLYEDHPPRLSGHAGSASARSDRPALMPVPEVDERLPIAPVPSLASVARDSAIAAPDASDTYRRALDLVRQRAFPEALRVLDSFLAHHAHDARAPRAHFWRGEVLFAQRAYGEALPAYEMALARDPEGEKAADALLKIGLCHKQLGAPERARGAFTRLRAQFPGSSAARMLKEEDA
jgi:tol-pal system protein YbgF